MDGEVIYFDDERGIGFATGSDGNRYVFGRDDLGSLQQVAKGTRIAFHADGDRAREIALRGRTHQPAGTARAAGPWGVAATETTGGAALPAPPSPRSHGAATLFGYFRRAVTSNYLGFRGRARRKEYWGFVLFSLLLMAFAGAAGFALGTALGWNESEEPVATTLAMGLVTLALFVPSLAVTVRRQHDIGLSGWFILLALVPWIGTMIIFVFTLIPSQKHENKWGPVPDGVC